MSDAVALPQLSGRLVKLEEVGPGRVRELLESITHEEVWAWKPEPRPRSIGEMTSLIEDAMRGPGRYPFAIVRLKDDQVIGSTTLHAIDLRHLRAEIGWTWLARESWGQGYNEDAKSLLLNYCFEVLRLNRVQATTDAENWRSQRALNRIGFTREGVLRSYRVRQDGSRSDTVVFSMLAEEWKAACGVIQQLLLERSAG